MKNNIPCAFTREALDALYARYNRREFVHPDPLEFLYEYHDPRDREIVGLLASSLAYGRVAQILRNVRSALERMHSPWEFLMRTSIPKLQRTFADFRHRFTTGMDLACLLFRAKGAVLEHGSLHTCFKAGLRRSHPTILPALCAFSRKLALEQSCSHTGLLPSPFGGSACKRLNLFLRWMVRRDAVDPGGWSDIPASKLIIPLDAHMHRIGLALGLTARKQADIRAAVEITGAFRKIAPRDPVRYDFALTRLGIRKDGDLDAFLGACSKKKTRAKE